MKTRNYLVSLVFLLASLFCNSILAVESADVESGRTPVFISDQSQFKELFILAETSKCELSACLAKCDGLKGVKRKNCRLSCTASCD